MAGIRREAWGAFESLSSHLERQRRELETLGRDVEASVRRFGGELTARGDQFVRDVHTQFSPATASPRPATNAPARRQSSASKPANSSWMTPIDTNDLTEQGTAFARGAQDGLTMGLGDIGWAGGGALFDRRRGEGFYEAYQRKMEEERARDRYDAAHYGVARSAGRITGAGVGFLALGPVDAAITGGTRLALATSMSAREAALLSTAGAASGVVAQGMSDIERRRLSTPGDYAGAAVGGTTAALASLGGRPGIAAAVGGATGSIAQDALNGRPIDFADASLAGYAGALAATPMGWLGRYRSNALPIKDKGRLGEEFGEHRTEWRGDSVGERKIRHHPYGSTKKKGYSVPDHKTKSGIYTEQKFGMKARESPNQFRSRMELSKKGLYRGDSYLPRDVGAAVAYPFGVVGAHLTEGEKNDVRP